MPKKAHSRLAIEYQYELIKYIAKLAEAKEPCNSWDALEDKVSKALGFTVSQANLRTAIRVSKVSQDDVVKCTTNNSPLIHVMELVRRLEIRVDQLEEVVTRKSDVAERE